MDAIDWTATAYSLVHSHAWLLQNHRAGYLFSLIVSFLIRVTLVALFLPFSAMDKLLNTEAAVQQAQSSLHSRGLSWVLVGVALLVEVIMSLAVITGVFDRLAAVILAGYCMVTAALWKQFWKTPDFRLKGPSKGRDVFWDFLKNFALAGGFLVLATGGTADGVSHLILHPFSSSHPYRSVPPDLRAPAPYATNPPEGEPR
ncbi:MAG: DoxX family protein [Rhodanobacter sp.]